MAVAGRGREPPPLRQSNPVVRETEGEVRVCLQREHRDSSFLSDNVQPERDL